MSGLEIVAIIGGVISGIASGISSFIHWRKTLKTRRDIREIKEHVRPRIIISSNGTLTPGLTPKEGEEMSEIGLNNKYEPVKLYYNSETGEYFENIPETPRPKHPY